MIFIRKLIRCSLLIGFCYIFICVCKSLSLLEIINKDWITWLEIENMLVIYLGILVVFYIFFIYTKSALTEIHILLKKHLLMIKFILICLMIISFYKSYNTLLMISFIFEFLLIYCLLDYESSKQYMYDFSQQNGVSNYTEQTVIGKGKLTNNQRRAYNQLENLICKRKSIDSFNIGLIGDWGSGKTSITDTLIYELEKENKYFFLKVSALTFNETGNIIEYVKDFFGDLFKRYEIDYYFGDSNVAFLGSLVMLNNNAKSIKDIVESVKGNSFVDLEKERFLFNKQVKRLLEVSKRKNIILMIDDMDRTYHQDNIIKLLSEFSSINGLITIVSLNNDDIDNKIFNHENKDDSGKETVMYRELDKYIHVRINLDKGNDIDYDRAVVNQIYQAYQERIVDLCYFDLNEENNHFSCFKTLREYPMKTIETNNVLLFNYNILFELFYENLKKSNMGFGKYLQCLINNYVYNTGKKTLAILDNYLDEEESENGKDITNMSYNVSFFSNNKAFSISDFYTNAHKFLNCIIEHIDLLKSKNIVDIKRFFSYLLEDKNSDSYFNKDKYLMNLIICSILNKEEIRKINELIGQSNYNEIKKIFINKLANIIQSTLIREKMNDFMSYLNKNISNYRSFKIQLREADVFEKDYLIYQMEIWEQFPHIVEKYKDKILKYYNSDKEIISIAKLIYFINDILIQNYILKFGTRFNHGELLNSKVFIYHGKNRKIVVISKKSETIENSIFLDITGEKLNDLTEEELEEIKKKKEIICRIK